MNNPRWQLKCEDCKYFYPLKKVSCFIEGQCTRYPPSVHPKGKYKSGQYFSYYPLVESIKEACGEYRKLKKQKIVK